MTELLLIRHGTTEANVRVPYILQGNRIDLSLNDNGRRQADQVAAFLASFPVQRVYASPLKRAYETADLIAERHSLAVPQLAVISERDAGQWPANAWPA